MTTDTHTGRPDADDEIALPRFEHELGLRLAEAHCAHRVAPAPATHGRAARRSLLVGAGTIAAAAAVVAVAVVARDPNPATEPPDLATRIIAATQEAEATTILHVNVDYAQFADLEDWHDETTDAYRFREKDGDGTPLFEYSLLGSDSLTVDYCFSEYSSDPGSRLAGGVVSLPVTAGSLAEWVQEMLEKGWLVEDGFEEVDGRKLTRLKVVVPDGGLEPRPQPGDTDVTEPPGAEPGAGAPAEASGYVLVDPDSYRPVKRVVSAGSTDPEDKDSSYVQTFEYLPRTPENLALVKAPVPAGFTEVPELRGPNDRWNAGCE